MGKVYLYLIHNPLCYYYLGALRGIMITASFRIEVCIISIVFNFFHKFSSWSTSTGCLGRLYAWKNACSVRAFNSTDIRSVQDNVATAVTGMMITVCISIDALSSVFISPDLSGINSFHQCCWTIIPITACRYRLQYLYHSVTPDWYSPVPVWHRQFWTVCRRQQSDTAMILYLCQAWRCNRL